MVIFWERIDLLNLLCVMLSFVFVTGPHGVLGQVWYLIVLIPEYFAFFLFNIPLLWLGVERGSQVRNHSTRNPKTGLINNTLQVFINLALLEVLNKSHPFYRFVIESKPVYQKQKCYKPQKIFICLVLKMQVVIKCL